MATETLHVRAPHLCLMGRVKSCFSHVSFLKLSTFCTNKLPCVYDSDSVAAFLSVFAEVSKLL